MTKLGSLQPSSIDSVANLVDLCNIVRFHELMIIGNHEGWTVLFCAVCQMSGCHSSDQDKSPCIHTVVWISSTLFHVWTLKILKSISTCCYCRTACLMAMFVIAEHVDFLKHLSEGAHISASVMSATVMVRHDNNELRWHMFRFSTLSRFG